MKFKKITGVVLLASIANTGCSIASPQSINTLSTTYDVAARQEFSDNDVISFVYDWFSAFDHQKVPGYFLNRIGEPVDMLYPDFPIKSKNDFLRWYKGVTDNIIWNSHVLKDLKVTGNQSTGWTVNYDVEWRARDTKNNAIEMNVRQEMKVVRVGDSFKISRLRVQVLD